MRDQRVPLSHRRTLPTGKVGIRPVWLLVVTPKNSFGTGCGGCDPPEPPTCWSAAGGAARRHGGESPHMVIAAAITSTPPTAATAARRPNRRLPVGFD